MSKLTKFFRHPILFWKDARAKKQGHRNSSDVTSDSVRKAREYFLQGESKLAEKELDEGGCPLDGKGHYLKAQIARYSGNYLAMKNHAFWCMMALTNNEPLFKQAFYLRLEAMRFLGRYDLAQEALDNIPFSDNTNRYYRALRLNQFQLKNTHCYEAKVLQYASLNQSSNRALFQYSILLRDLGFYSDSISIVRELFIKNVKEKKYAFASIKKNTDRNWLSNAKKALSDLKEDLSSGNIDFFLISGTLLGCVREKSILGHDNDIDVGIDERYSIDSIKNAISSTGRFRLLEISYENNVYVQHVNGVNIDIFRHFLENGRYIHEGIKVRWWNTPFSLKEVDFLDGKYLIPENEVKYLEENYGNWKNPVSEFETFVDTPNMEVTVEGQLLWYYMSKLSDYYKQGKKAQFLRVWQAYKNLQPDPWIEEKIIKPLLNKN